MSKITHMTIAIVKPNKAIVARHVIKATDRAWRTAIFGLGGSSKRIAGARLGTVLGQPLSVICELPAMVKPGTPIWTIQGAIGLFAFAGPAAVFNDAGYGPANLGLSVDQLRGLIGFDPDPIALAEGLANTLKAREEKDA